MSQRTVETRFTANVDPYLAGVSRMESATASFATKAGSSVKATAADFDKMAKTSEVAGQKVTTSSKATQDATAKAAASVKTIRGEWDQFGRSVPLAGERYYQTANRAKTATTQFTTAATKSLRQNEADWNRVAGTTTVAGLAIGAVVATSAKKFADFEQQMSKVAAVADATTRQQKALSEAAIQAGQDTVFSATEAADAEAELAKAGVQVSDILGGALRGSLDLAAAGQVDLADSAEIAAQAMNIFNLAGEDVTHIADVLTAGANKSAAGVDDLGQALQQGGLVAKQTGLTLEETVATLSAFSDNALKGSDAGTSMKTMLQRLNPQSDEAATLMDELGLRAYDAQGNFVGLAEYSGMLQKALGSMSDEQRNATLQTLFGSDAVRGANVLYEQGEAGIRQYIRAVDDQGAAQRMASRQTDNLKGDIEQLTGTLESAFIRGGSGSNDAIREMVQGVTEIVDKFNQLPPEVQAGTVKVAAATAGVLLLAGAGIKATTSILALKASLDAAGLSGARLATVSKALGAATVIVGVAALANEVAKYARNAQAAVVDTDKLASSLDALATGKGDTGGIQDLFRNNGIFARDVENATDALDQFAENAQIAFGQNTTDKLERFGDFGTTVKKFTDQVDQVDSSLATLVQNGHADEAAAAYQRFMDRLEQANAEGANIDIDQVSSQFGDYQESLDTAAVAQKSVTDSGKDLSENLQQVKSSAEEAKQEVDDYLQSLVDAGLAVLSTRDAQRGYEQAIDDSKERVKEYRKEFLEEAKAKGLSGDAAKAWAAKQADAAIKAGNALDITTQAGRDNQAALDDVADSILGVAQAVYDETGSEEEFRRSLVKSRDSLVETGRRFGLSKKEAEEFADQVLKIPPSKTVTVKDNLAAAKKRAEAYQSYINGLRGNDITITTRYVDTRPAKNGSRQLGGGITVDADGGMHTKTSAGLVKAYAGGGMFDGSFASAQPQIRPAGGRGVLWSEEGAGPWEGFVSGHPAKASRSRDVTEDIAARLGGVVTWKFADGGMFRSAAPTATASAAGPSSREVRNYRTVSVAQVVAANVEDFIEQAAEAERVHNFGGPL